MSQIVMRLIDTQGCMYDTRAICALFIFNPHTKIHTTNLTVYLTKTDYTFQAKCTHASGHPKSLVTSVKSKTIK